jgi:hypothetical protein
MNWKAEHRNDWLRKWRIVMSTRTTFLARLIGLYSILISFSMLIHRQVTVETITALVHSAPLVFLAGLMAVSAGMAIILGHNIWSGGAVPVIVTLAGWLTLIKGLLLLWLLPNETPEVFLGGLHYAQLFYFYAGISFLLGLYLVYGSFRQQRTE